MTTTCSPIMTPFPARVVMILCKLLIIDSVFYFRLASYKFNIFSIMQYLLSTFSEAFAEGYISGYRFIALVHT